MVIWLAKINLAISIIRIRTIVKDGVIYNGPVDASTVPPEWHSWLHKIIKTTPDQIKFHDFNWQKEHKKNLTGTNKAYKPDHKKTLPYNKWQPK